MGTGAAQPERDGAADAAPGGGVLPEHTA